MTVAQLVHPAYGVARKSRESLLRALHRSARYQMASNVALWRDIFIGFGLALLSMAIMAVAIGGAGIAHTAQAPSPGISASAQSVPAHPAAPYSGGP